MKKVLINCGSQKCNFPDEDFISRGFEIHCFEPNPIFFECYNTKEAICFHPEAVWIYDGTVDFIVGRPKAGSIIKDKTSGLNLTEGKFARKVIVVKCVDFSAFIKKFYDYDYIRIICDIEGAEYKVLQKLYDDGVLQLIHEIRVEWHWYKMGMTREQQDSFVSKVMEKHKVVEAIQKMGLKWERFRFDFDGAKILVNT